MKKLSIFAIAIGAGAILLAYALNGFSEQRLRDDIQHIGHSGYADKHATFDSSPIQNIKVNADNLKVTVKTGTDTSHVAVDYAERATDKFAIDSSNGTLSISRPAEKRNVFCFLRCINTPDTLTIYVPANAVYAYDLTAENAPVTFDLTSTLQTNALHITSSNSNVRLQHLAVNGAVDLQSSNGAIRLEDVTASGNLKLESSNDRNELVRVQAPTISVESDNGGTVVDTVTTKDLSVRAGNDSITLVRLATERGTIINTNGSVKGTIVGSKEAYNIKMTNENGDIRVNNYAYGNSYFSDGNAGAKDLVVNASNASIEINFVP